MIYLKDNKINKLGNNKIYFGDKLIYQAVKEKPVENCIISNLTTTSEDQSVKLFNTNIFFKSVVINDTINVDINSTTNYTFNTPGTYTIKYILDETKTWFNSMFNGCFELTSLDFSNAQTSQITDINSLLGNCYNLADLNISKFNTSNVIKMSGTFQGCTSLTSLDLAHFDTSKVTDMSRLFSQCIALERLDLSNFDITLVTKFDYMFSNSNSLNYIKCKQAFKDWCIENQDTIMLPVSMRDGGGGTWDIVDIEEPPIVDSNASLHIYQAGSTAITLKPQYFSSILLTDTNNELIVGGSEEKLEYTFEATGDYNINYSEYKGLTSFDSMFNGVMTLYRIDVGDFDTSNLQSTRNMFTNTQWLEEIYNINTWYTSKLTDIYEMFSYSAVRKIDLTGWDTSNVNNMYAVFMYLTFCTEIKMNGCVNNNVTDAFALFGGSSMLERIEIDSFTPFVEGCNVTSMFYGCNKLNYIKCTEAFRDWCWQHQDDISLPTTMREGGGGIWDIVD